MSKYQCNISNDINVQEVEDTNDNLTCFSSGQDRQIEDWWDERQENKLFCQRESNTKTLGWLKRSCNRDGANAVKRHGEEL